MDKIIDRIRKLMELAHSSNEHEAAVAAARAAEMMVEHQISETELAAKRGQVDAQLEPFADELVDGDQEGKITLWRFWILNALAESMGGDVYRGMGSEMKVIAPQSAMTTIRYLYAYLTKQVDELANMAYKEEADECSNSGVNPPGARSWKTAFRAGASHTISKRIQLARNATINQFAHQHSYGPSNAMVTLQAQMALTLLDRQKDALQVALRKSAPWRYGKRGQELRRGSGNAGQGNSSGWSAGTEAGGKVALPGGNKQLVTGQKQLKG
jgi:hypothetical protein